ncbi:MAG TPA: anhydro-N-acetylmuramic acid kinase [Candidatus Kapabacteria bacterium]|nr:anhydro-N-acetylmuramic acid kinase [Candidatus Kapabacteria bacterium]HYM35109.1 anhydro-N-acetylmuramic acid kinase [Steroidobacteraceae bacterium]
MNITTTPDDLFIGIMSGTSLDGIDVVIARFGNTVESIARESFPFDKNIRDMLHTFATASSVKLDEFVRMHFSLAALYADAVSHTLERAKRSPTDIRAIGMHGQTVRHLPSAHATFQLGSGSALAARTGIDVVSDFRSGDVAIGGQGAPLVPMFDAIFLRDEHQDRVTLNIGGIANITILPARKKSGEIIAYDTGPGNMLIDELAHRYFAKAFDEDGGIARSGVVNEALVREMLSHPYFSSPEPKSTGRELFGQEFLTRFIDLVDSGYLKENDAVATATDLTARSIAHSLQTERAEVITSGGGAKNAFLMERLTVLLPNCKITTSDELGIPSQAKEAIAFAYFAKAYLDQTYIHLPRTTGADWSLILGSLSRGK